MLFRSACSSTPSKVSVSVVAIALNGIGTQTTLPLAGVESFGPDELRVATFNLYAPGNHSDAIYERWGQELGAKADVLLLTEVIDQRRAELVANGARMPHVVKMQGGDVAIASRAPIYGFQSRTIDPPGTLTSNDSHIFSVLSDIGGFPHQFIGTHWGIREANDVQAPAHLFSPSRLAAANAILALVPTSAGLVFVGGDFNAYSGHGPQDHDGDSTTPDFVGFTAEVAALMQRFFDPFVELNVPNEAHCSNQRIDYVLGLGQYIPKKYEACFTQASPSDHPFVLVTFEAGDR